MDSTLLNNTSNSISEQKYVNLRKRLDQLGYRQTLGIESLPLIEKLFNDLVHTTESLKKAKLDLSKNVDMMNTSLKNLSSTSLTQLNDSSQVPAAIQAYKSDNAKLIKENNELHLQLIKFKDEYEVQIRDLKSKIHKIDHENSDLRFLNTQYLHKMRSIEKESKDKSKKIIELQEKNFQAVIQTPSGAKQSISFRRQRLDIDCMLPAPSVSSSHSNTSGRCVAPINDPYLVDMIKLADDRITHLQNELDAFKQSNELLDQKVQNFKSQVDHRDREIERLNRLLDGGRSYDVVSLEANIRNNEKLISHQNLQIEFLQEKNHQLERRLQEFMDAKRDVINEKYKNEDLVRDIKEINRIAKKAELEKQMVANAADRELDQAKLEIKRSREELSSLDSVVHQLEIEKHNLTNELNEFKLELEMKLNEINTLHSLIDKIQDDKTKLSKKITKLLENEKELVQELDAFKSGRRSTSNLTRTNSQKSLTAKLDSHIKNIEHERDYFKQEVDTLQKLLKVAQHDQSLTRSISANRLISSGSHNMHHTTQRSVSPTKQRSLTNHKSRKENGISPATRLGNKSSSPGTRCSVCSAKFNKNSATQLTSKSPSSYASEEVAKLRRERDELQKLLDKFEHHMVEIQANVKVLTNERDKLNQLYDESNQEVQRLRHELLKNSKNQNTSLAAQAILKRVETEREAAIFDLRNAITDRDSYKERLKMNTEAAIKDKAILEAKIEDMQSLLRKSELDKKELCQQIDLLQSQLEQLESKIHAQNYHLVQTTQDLNEQKSASTQIRLLAEDSERALDEQRRQLAIKNDEIHNLEQVNFKLEQKLIDLQELNRSLKDEISALRTTIGALDKDKDKLLVTIDEKTVENVTFKQELSSKHRRIEELNSQLAQLDNALDRANDDVKSKLKEVTALRIQVDRTNEENSELSRRYESAIRENKRLQDDLITVTRENQVIHCELDKSNADKDHLKEQLQDYINEVAKFEELLNQKEQDRSNLLEQYRDMTNEMNSMKLTLNSFESETSNLRIELQMKHNDNKRVRDRLDTIERDYQQQIGACQEYEVKLSNANRNLQRLEEAFKKLQTENNEILQDLMHTRDLNSRLEQSKEDLTRQMTGKELDYEQMQNELADRRAESELLKSQINSERTMVKNLEELIANNREKDFQMQLNTQERDSEIKLLKDRIALGEQKIQTQNKEITSLRSRLVEYESDLERMKRQLTNERFERERAAQELRKLTETNDLAANRFNRSLSPMRSLHSQSTQPITVPLTMQQPTSTTSTTSSHHNHHSHQSILSSTTSSNSGTSAAAAAVAAAAAAVAASNAAAAASGYRSLSPKRSLSPCKDHHHHHISSISSSRYSLTERRTLSPSNLEVN